MSTTTWIILGVIVVLVLWIIMIYNGLVAMRQRVNQAFADIDVQMKMRHDLIPNLVETVKGYASHERGTLEAVIKARQTAIQAQSGGVAAQAAASRPVAATARGTACGRPSPPAGRSPPPSPDRRRAKCYARVSYAHFPHDAATENVGADSKRCPVGWVVAPAQFQQLNVKAWLMRRI